MAVSVSRMFLYFVGILCVVAGAIIFFVQSGLSRWVPTSLLAAGVLLIIGLSVMGFADSTPDEHRRVEHRDRDDDVTIIRNR